MSESDDHQRNGSGRDAAPPDDAGRSFCHLTGLIYWMAGLALSLGTCCVWWPASGCRDRVELNEKAAAAVNPFLEADAAQRLWMVAVCASFCGGMLLLPIGMALQFDRLRRGVILVILPGLIAVYSLAYLAYAVIELRTFAPIAVAYVMTMIWGALLILGGVSAEELKRHPPPRRTELPWTPHEEAALRKAASRRGPDEMNR